MEDTVPVTQPQDSQALVSDALARSAAFKASQREHACVGCIFKGRTCGSRGPVDSPFVIVGESPGRNEIATGVPFSGESGELLKGVMKGLGYNYDTYPEPYVTNAIKCWPGIKKDQPSLANACRACRTNLYAEISSHPREVILALGAAAIWSLTGDFKAKITQIRGTIYPSPLATRGIVASVHPAFLLRGGGSLPKFRSDVGLAADVMRNIKRPTYVPSREVVVRSERRLAQLYQGLRNRTAKAQSSTLVASDIETTGFRSLEHRILCTGIGWKPHVAYVIPEHLVACATAKQFLEEPSFEFLWHNGKFDVQFLRRRGIQARVDHDLMLASYTLDENKGLHDLEQVSNDAVGAPNWKGILDSYLKSKSDSYEVIPKPVLYKYLGKDVSATLQSYAVLRRRIEANPKYLTAYREVLITGSEYLACVESAGILVDQEQNKRLSVELQAEMEGIQAELDTLTLEAVGRTVNINSPIQVARLLFEDLKLEYDGKPDTRKDTLEALPPHPAVKLILAYRKANKAKGTYVDNLYDRPRYGKRGNILGTKVGHVQSDGRVHATYLLHGTVTGRLSSRKPNLQNIPRDPKLRGQFCAGPGNLLFEVDLNQAELRCLAELSGDPGLMAIYLDPEHPGLHHEVSVTLFGEGYTDDHKMRAKAVNFGIVYGRTGASLASEFELSDAEGDRWVSGWFKRFPVAAQFIQDCRATPLRGRALVTPFGRHRRFGIINRGNKQSVENEASNFLHQSIASDITLLANAKAIKDPTYKGLPVNVIHDAGLHETNGEEENVLQQIALVKGYMEREALLWGLKRVPFKADAKVGTHWGRLKKPSLWFSKAA